MDREGKIKAFARYGIDKEESEIRYTVSRDTTEKWRRDLFEEFWTVVDDSKMLGSNHELRYAEDLKELIHTLEQEDPAPAGFTFYWSYSYGKWKGCTATRVYRARYPVLADGDLSPSEITEVAQRERVVLLDEDDATTIFGELIDQDFGHVNPVSDDCVIKPKEALNGLYRIVWAPKRVKALRTRHVNDAEKARKEREAREREAAEAMAAKKREYAREKLWEKRRRYLYPIAKLLEYHLERELGWSDVVAISSPDGSSYVSESGLVIYVQNALRLHDRLLAGPVDCLDTRSRTYKNMRRKLKGRMGKYGPLVSAAMRNLEGCLGVYADPLANRDQFPARSGIKAEGPPPNSEREKSYAAIYQSVYERLESIAGEIEARRKSREALKEASKKSRVVRTKLKKVS